MGEGEGGREVEHHHLLLAPLILPTSLQTVPSQPLTVPLGLCLFVLQATSFLRAEHGLEAAPGPPTRASRAKPQALPGPDHPEDTPPEPPFLNSDHTVVSGWGRGFPEEGRRFLQSWVSNPILVPQCRIPPGCQLSIISQKRIQKVPLT